MPQSLEMGADWRVNAGVLFSKAAGSCARSASGGQFEDPLPAFSVTLSPLVNWPGSRTATQAANALYGGTCTTGWAKA